MCGKGGRRRKEEEEGARRRRRRRLRLRQVGPKLLPEVAQTLSCLVCVYVCNARVGWCSVLPVF